MECLKSEKNYNKFTTNISKYTFNLQCKETMFDS